VHGLLSTLAEWTVLASTFDTVKGILGVLIGVGALIFFHELGHYLAAKWAGVKVEVFSLGFGNRLFGFVHGGTDYRVSMLPLGGYVKMLGQADDNPTQAPTDRQDDFRNKSVGKRFVILVAGVVMNVILAAFGFVLAFGIGLELDAPEIGAIQPGSAARGADLRPGDIILEINDAEILGWQDVSALVALSDGELKLNVLRGGKTHTTQAKPIRKEGETFARLGITQSSVLTGFTPESPMGVAGALLPTPTRSDRILNVSPVSSRCAADLRMSALDWSEVIADTKGPLALTLERTEYDPLTHRPLGTERVEAIVEFPQIPTWTLGGEFPDQAWVRGVSKGSAAEAAGVKVGDRVVSLAENPDVKWSDLADTVKETGAVADGNPVELVVERLKEGDSGESERVTLEVTLRLENTEGLAVALDGVTDPAERLAIRRSEGHYLLGVNYRADVLGAAWELPLADEDDEKAVIGPGDRVVSLWLSGGLYWNLERPFGSPQVLTEVLNARKDEPLRIDWLPKGSDELKSAVVKASQHSTQTVADLGFRTTSRQRFIQRGPIGACGLGLQQTWIQTRRILRTLQSFFTGAVSPKELGGPIQIARVSYAVATRNSFAQLLQLLAILSVNLAVINILPIPILDGGHIFFLLIEKLKGRPVSGDVMIWAQWIGLACILALMALVFFNDIARLGQ
jgi:regulator of sigma E protease